MKRRTFSRGPKATTVSIDIAPAPLWSVSSVINARKTFSATKRSTTRESWSSISFNTLSAVALDPMGREECRYRRHVVEWALNARMKAGKRATVMESGGDNVVSGRYAISEDPGPFILPDDGTAES